MKKDKFKVKKISKSNIKDELSKKQYLIIIIIKFIILALF